MKPRILLAAAIAVLVVQCDPIPALAAAVQWRKGETCGRGEPVRADENSGLVKLDDSESAYVWCPDSTTGGGTSPTILAVVKQACEYDDGGTGATLSVVGSISGQVVHTAPADAACDPDSGNATCSLFNVPAGNSAYLTAGTAGRIVCRPKKEAR